MDQDKTQPRDQGSKDGAGPPPDRRGRDTPFCDEFSGGGGSAPDTRDRGLPGGSREGDCDPLGRGEP
ncbi:hypothetical protein [Azospirillum thermophilum]|uniref:Uncharacterized protein n=1 Tax=Azospirillum thermophilum TaxID=2202148 RepID=A0A2S2CSU3_9PROT|nr:hypothetical protein [Azospirillum thermophilum]AWK87546.1 hypothetical protein DEW08_16150 [Azospirillum thermophilum]